jgi:hypothetical protein
MKCNGIYVVMIEERFLSTRPGAQKSGGGKNRVAAFEMTDGGAGLK